LEVIHARRADNNLATESAQELALVWAPVCWFRRDVFVRESQLKFSWFIHQKYFVSPCHKLDKTTVPALVSGLA
jgi:hypothetical protein